MPCDGFSNRASHGRDRWHARYTSSVQDTNCRITQVPSGGHGGRNFQDISELLAFCRCEAVVFIVFEALQWKEIRWERAQRPEISEQDGLPPLSCANPRDEALAR